VLDKAELEPEGKITVSTSVTNTCQRAGRAWRPVRLLHGFQRVTLAPGETGKVSFTLDEANVRYWNTSERGWVIDWACSTSGSATVPLRTATQRSPLAALRASSPIDRRRGCK